MAESWTIEDKCSSPWHYLPVDVPAGSSALKVELHYEAPGAALDLGCFGPAGFRGWSGGARRSFLITAESATPGYLPGELAPGTWQVVLGLHRIPAAGVRYELTAEATRRERRRPARPRTSRSSRRSLTARPAATSRPRLACAGWPATCTRTPCTPTACSPFPSWPGSRPDAAWTSSPSPTTTRSATIANCPPQRRAYQIALLPGQEVTTEQGHANAFGDLPWIDFREPPDAWLEAAEPAGGLLSINHPYGGQVSWTAPMRRQPAADRDLALELARPALDRPAELVAGLAPGRDRGRRQRLAPAGLRRAAGLTDDLGARRRSGDHPDPGWRRRGQRRDLGQPGRPVAAPGRGRTDRGRRRRRDPGRARTARSAASPATWPRSAIHPATTGSPTPDGATLALTN